MKGYTRVKKVQDTEGHWYWIAEESLTDFRNRVEYLTGIEYMDEPDAFDKFIDFYSEYRTHGHPDNVPKPFEGKLVELI